MGGLERSQMVSAFRDAQFETVACDFCGKLDSVPFLLALRLVRCLGCGLIYAGQRLPLEVLRGIYSKEYFVSHESSELGYDNYGEARDEIRRTFQRRLERLEKLRGGRKGRALDVGCAMGFFVEMAKENGWQAQGIDISEFCVSHAKSQGLAVEVSTLSEWKAPGGSLDLITMWDYIEHSPNPSEDLEKSYELLSPGGILALATPDVSSIPAKIFKQNWMGFKDHEHLYYFSSKILAKRLKAIGFEIAKRRFAGKYVSLEFFARRLELYFSPVSKLILAMIQKKWIPNAEFYCNPMDITLIVARKPYTRKSSELPSS